MPMDKQAIIENIERAWVNVPYPGDDRIFTPDSNDDEGIRDYFSGTSWHGHAPEELRGHCSAISTFFTPEAYHYWLPAYLIAAVEDPEELSQGVDAILDSLKPEGIFEFPEQKMRLELLTQDQLLAVIEAVEYLEQKFADPSHPKCTEEEKRVISFLRRLHGSPRD